jgi:hypothetical protein
MHTDNITNKIEGTPNKSKVNTPDGSAFIQHIAFLRSNLSNLISYGKLTGASTQELERIHKNLFNEDPFTVIQASIQASKVLENSSAITHH